MAENETPIEEPEAQKIEVETDADANVAAASEQTAGDDPAADPSDDAVPSVESLQKDLAAAQEKINDLSDRAVRAQAEMQNVRRRAERDVENAHKFGLEKFANDLLAVVDSLERGLESLDAEDENLQAAREGMALTLKMQMDVLQKHGVEQVNPMGEPFDPNLHEAMSMVESPDAEPNSVIAVMQRGYTLNGRLIRPAMVMIAKAPA